MYYHHFSDNERPLLLFTSSWLKTTESPNYIGGCLSELSFNFFFANGDGSSLSIISLYTGGYYYGFVLKNVSLIFVSLTCDILASC